MSEIPDFEIGEEYDIDDLPDSDMTHSGKLESIGMGKYAGWYGDKYVVFEFSTVVCTDVQDIAEQP